MNVVPKKTLLTFAALALLAAPIQASGKVVAPGDLAPDTRGRDHNNKLHIIDYSEAELTVINFWATWCEPCLEEMPALERFHRELSSQGLQVIGITHEAIEDQALGEFLQEMDITYPVVRATPKVKKYWVGASGSLPNTYLVGKDGKVIRRYVGASDTQIEEMKYDVVAVLEGRPLGKMTIPHREAIATPEDRVRKARQLEERRKALEGDKPD